MNLDETTKQAYARLDEVRDFKDSIKAQLLPIQRQLRDIQAQFDEKLYVRDRNDSGILLAENDVRCYKQCLELDTSRLDQLDSMLLKDEQTW